MLNILLVLVVTSLASERNPEEEDGEKVGADGECRPPNLTDLSPEVRLEAGGGEGVGGGEAGRRPGVQLLHLQHL